MKAYAFLNIVNAGGANKSIVQYEGEEYAVDATQVSQANRTVTFHLIRFGEHPKPYYATKPEPGLMGMTHARVVEPSAPVFEHDVECGFDDNVPFQVSFRVW